jgi:cyclohexadienyl dehydratase
MHRRRLSAAQGTDVMRSWRWICACLACALVFAAAPCRARTLETIEASGELKVGMTGDYAPYDIQAADGTFSGTDVTMARKVAQNLGVTLKIVPTTWRSLQDDLVSDRFDIAMGGVSITAARAAIGLFSRPVMRDGKRPIVRCANKELFTSIAAIDQLGVVVDVNQGGTNEAFAKAHFPHAKLREYPDNRDIFDDLAAGHADVIVTDGAEVDFQARRHAGVLCPADVADTFDHFEKAYWMTPDPSLKAAVDAVVTNSLNAGDYGKIFAP